MAALIEGCESLVVERSDDIAEIPSAARSEVAAFKAREKKLLDAYPDGFQEADEYNRREIVQTVLWNLGVEDGDIASYQWKGPFELLEKEPSGAFKNQWWAILDLNQ